ncbi:MAG: hypothetical protein HFE73_10455 [Firmicutes bacterium]|jgi:hypothetical protein|nr:hypothetical protein [Bacillota bacterium]
MKGIQHVEVSNRSAQFKFDLYRNITIVRGDSGTGKTTLYNMIADYTRLGSKSGVNISSKKSCVALVDLDWKNQLKQITDSIVFIDEGSDFIVTKEFAKAIKGTDNYYVIFNREGLHELPYSVEEIYEIKTSGRFHKFEKIFKAAGKHVYSKNRSRKKLKFDILLTEDSNSGYQFFNRYLKESGICCETAGSNSAIFKWLLSHPNKVVLVVADGAAFGSEIDRVLKLQATHPDFISVCLPESFEWLILKSGLIKVSNLHDVLENPSEYIESKKYFSWENFFEDYLIKISSNIVNGKFQYKKSKINDAYLIEVNSNKIMEEIPLERNMKLLKKG